MRILGATTVLALAALLGVANAADRHVGGLDAIKGKPDGRHRVHSTLDGHSAFAHVKNGKVSHVSVDLKKGPIQTKKVKTVQKRHASAPTSTDIFLASAESESCAAVQVWVGWAFFNEFSNHWVFIWFPIDVVIGGADGAENID